MASIPWRVIATSITGNNHLQRGTECQDAHRHRQLDSDVLVLAVADGAGSARRSAEGSSMATGITLAVLEETLRGRPLPCTPEAWTDLALNALRQTVERFLLATHALAGDSATAKDFATTLSLVVLSGPWTIYAGVGDGFLVLQTSDEQLFLPVPPRQIGEYRNETVFLTTEGWEEYAEVRSIWEPGRTAVALSTDGLVRAVLEHRPSPLDRIKMPVMPHAGFFAGVFRLAADPGFDPRQLYIEMMDKRYDEVSGDDRTLLLAVRR